MVQSSYSPVIHCETWFPGRSVPGRLQWNDRHCQSGETVSTFEAESCDGERMFSFKDSSNRVLDFNTINGYRGDLVLNSRAKLCGEWNTYSWSEPTNEIPLNLAMIQGSTSVRWQGRGDSLDIPNDARIDIRTGAYLADLDMMFCLYLTPDFVRVLIVFIKTKNPTLQDLLLQFIANPCFQNARQAIDTAWNFPV